MSPAHDAEFKTLMRNIKHGQDLVASLSELHTTGQFADVKLVCADGSIWSHRPLLAAVSPVLHKLLLNSVNDDIVTVILPQLRRTHLKLVLDYVYSGSMYLRATQMQYVIGVIEVLHLKCGVSVSKRNDSECAWVEEAEFKDVSDKTFGDFFIAPQISCSDSIISNSSSDSSKIKRELDCNVASALGDICHLPPNTQMYLEKAVCTTNNKNYDKFSQPGSHLYKDSTLCGKKDVLSFKHDLDGSNQVNQGTRKFTTAMDDIHEHMLVKDDEFQEESEHVLVRPITADLPEESSPKRRSSFDESYSVVEVETESSDDADEEVESNINNDILESGSTNDKSKGRTNSIDSQSRVSSGSVHGASKCVMCGKEFQHNANLRIHLQSHLGTKTQLKSCDKCDRNFRSAIEYDLHMNGHKYSQLLGVKRKQSEYKTRNFQRSVYAKLVRKSIRICTTSHKRGDLLDKLSDWIKYAARLEKKRQRKVAFAKKIEQQQLIDSYRKNTSQKRESKDIRTKSKSSFSPTGNAKFQHIEATDNSESSSNNFLATSPLSPNAVSKDIGNTHGVGKVKLKIRVDPSRYKDTPNSSPSSYFSSTPMYFNRKKDHRIPPLSSPLLQSALLASTNRNIDYLSTSLSMSSPTMAKKLLNCAHCSKQFTIRSSFLRHARTQHGIDTKSQPFLQYLKYQGTKKISAARQGMESFNLSLPTKPLPPSKINSRKATSFDELNSTYKNVSTDAYGGLSNKKKRKIRKPIAEKQLIKSSQAPASHSNKKIKLSLKLGKSKTKANVRRRCQNDTPESSDLSYSGWQSSSFQELSPATSPSSKVSQYATDGVERTTAKNSAGNLHSNAFSPKYAFESPSTSPSLSTNTKSSKRNSVQDLTCPTCDKSFPAKSIFERHIKTYKHGRYEIYEHATPPPSYIPISSDEPQLPHLNPVLQPTIDLGGREVNKYECHLCNQVFLRVRDLAKHRERMMCTAWLKN